MEVKTYEGFFSSEPKRKIVIYPADILRTKCHDLKEAPKELIEDMWKVLNKRGVGLAASQVGEDVNLFLVKFLLNKFAMINPRIIKKSVETDIKIEGCLSIPGKSINVRRHKEIEVIYRDENFDVVQKKFNGYIARIIQHEYDHLQGKLIIDYENR